MAPLLAGAAILVATAAAMSLLIALPAAALAEAAGEENAAGRARAWLAAIVVPPAIGLLSAGWGLILYAQGMGASPHIGGVRPHLCLLPVREAPSGAFTLRILAWVALAVLVAAIVRLLASATTSHLLRRMVVTNGAPLRDTEAQDGALMVDLGRPVSFTAGLLRPVVVVATSLAEALDEPELEAILAHERAHACRHDNLTWLLAEACVTLTAPMPTAWYFRARLREAAEQAADDAAIAAGVSAEELRSALDIAGRAARQRPGTPSLASLLIPAPAQPHKRAERLAGLEPQDVAAARASGRMQAWIAAGIGVAIVAALLLAARQAVDDSLYCAAEQLLRVVG